MDTSMDSVQETRDIEIDGLEIKRELGRGGMSVVYLASEKSIGRDVAVKILLQESISNESALKRFRQEAVTLSSLQHPNIVQIFRFDLMTDGTPYIVMEILTGRSLDKIIRDNGALKQSQIKAIFLPLLSALEAAHARGIIHRDIKPGNIVVEGDGENCTVKLVDFGIARNFSAGSDQKLTQTGALLGSPAYMSPEQCTGGTLDERSDLYCVGAVLYEAIVGGPLFSSDGQLDLLYKQVHQRPDAFSSRMVPHSIPRQLETVVQKALSKNPKDRYANATEMKNALESVLSASAADEIVQPHGGGVRRLMAMAVAAVLVVTAAFFLVRTGVYPSKAGPIPLDKAWDTMQKQFLQKQLPLQCLTDLESAIALDPKPKFRDRFDKAVVLINHYRRMRRYKDAANVTASVLNLVDDTASWDQKTELDIYRTEFGLRTVSFSAEPQAMLLEKALDHLKEIGDRRRASCLPGDCSYQQNKFYLKLYDTAADLATLRGKYRIALQYRNLALEHAENIWKPTNVDLLIGYLDKAQLLLYCGEEKKCRECCELVESRSLSDEDGSRKIWLRLANLYRQLNEKEKAKEKIALCVDAVRDGKKMLPQEQAAIRRLAARVMLLDHNLEGAQWMIQSSLEIGQRNQDPYLADSFFVQGEVYLAQGDRERAKNAFVHAQHILDTNPLWNNDITPQLYRRDAQMQMDEGNLDRAIKRYTEACNAWPLLYVRNREYETLLIEYCQVLKENQRAGELLMALNTLEAYRAQKGSPVK